MKKGETGTVETIGLPVQIKRRLTELGLTENTDITLVQKRRRGNVVFRVRGIRYAAGKRVAEGIFVKGNSVD